MFQSPQPDRTREPPTSLPPMAPPDPPRKPTQAPREQQLPAPRDTTVSKVAMKPTVSLYRNTSRTAKHKGISILSPTMDSRHSYDPPKPVDPAKAMLATIEKQFGLSKESLPPSALLMEAMELGRNPETGLQEECNPALLQSFKALKGKRSV